MGRKAKLKRECNQALKDGVFDKLSDKVAKRINRLYKRDVANTVGSPNIITYKMHPCQKNSKYIAYIPINAVVVKNDEGLDCILNNKNEKEVIVSFRYQQDLLLEEQKRINAANKQKEQDAKDIINMKPTKLG